jgi:DinB family protein
MAEAQLHMIERRFVTLAEAMPEDKYAFAPTGAQFSGVRTIALEVRHVAMANSLFTAHSLGGTHGATVDGTANGRGNLQTNQQILQYLKDSFSDEIPY